MADDLLSIDLGFKVGFEVSIHPIVIIQILDLYYRKYGYLSSKEEGQAVKIAGSLMGTVYTNKIHITNCYAVTVEEDQDEPDMYSIDFAEHQAQYDTHIQSYPNEVLLGAYVSGDLNLDIGIAYLSQEYGKKENNFVTTALLTQPVILKIDPSLVDGKYNMKAFRLNQSLKEYASVASFNVLPIKVEFLDEKYTQVVPFIEREDGVQATNFKLIESETITDVISQSLKNIQTLDIYIQSVIDGKVEGNEDLGRKLLSYLNKLHFIQSENFIKEYNSLSQEAQLVQYLSNLALSQTIIGEKLAKI